MNNLNIFKREIATNGLVNVSLAISVDLCFGMFPSNKSIFTETFYVNESTINSLTSGL